MALAAAPRAILFRLPRDPHVPTLKSRSPAHEDPADRRRILDAIDRRILAELQADGRITNVELARRAGISAPPCLRRVRRLEEAGMIRGYHADTDPQKLGWEIMFFAIVGLESQKEAVLSGFRAAGRQLARGPRVPHDPRRRRFPAEAGGARHRA